MFPTRSPDMKKIILSGALTMIVALVAVLGIVDFSSRSIDAISKANEEGLIERALVREKERLVEDVSSASMWNDAYFGLDRVDSEWLQVNFGDYYADYMGHEVTIAYNGHGMPVYASRESEAVDPASERAVLDAVASLVARMQAEGAKRRFNAAGDRNIAFAAVAKASGLVKIGSDIYVVSASTVVPDQPTDELSPEPDGVVLSGRRISSLLASLSKDLGIRNPVVTSPLDSGDVATPLVGLDGTHIGAIAWTPAKPGAAILNQALILIVCVTLALGLAALLLLRHVTRILDRLAENRAALTASLADLTVARDAARAASLAKSQFLASISHEIRTPLNGILGMAQSLGMSDISPDDREKVGVILSSGGNLTAILNDVLDISKIEAGKLQVAPIPSDVLVLCRQTISLFESLADAKSLSLRFEHDHLEQTRFALDPVRFQQCLSNLLSNAIKFTRTGGVTVALRVGRTGDDWRISVDVVDTGIGMEPDTVARLFDNFMQADESTTREFGGTGLGLAISRRLARLMSGDITVESKSGVGTTFTLTVGALAVEGQDLPIVRDTPSPVVPSSGRRQRILVVDDNAVNRQVVKLLLAGEGIDLLEAANGREALDRLGAEAIDLVLLDVHMPVMDGRECIARIRATSAGWRSIPVIALTAEAMEGDRERLLASGMTDYVAKPIDRAMLVHKVHGLLGRSGVLADMAPSAMAQADAVLDMTDFDSLISQIERNVA